MYRISSNICLSVTISVGVCVNFGDDTHPFRVSIASSPCYHVNCFLFAHLIPFRKRFAQTGDYVESYFDSNTLFCVPFSVRPGNVCCITQK